MRRRAYPVVLVAYAGVAEVVAVCERHELSGLVDSVVASEAVGAAKPDRRMFQAALRRLGLATGDAPRVVIVGNRLERDVREAAQLGMVTVWMDASPRYRKTPVTALERPHHVIAEPLPLPILDRLEAG